MLEYKNKWNCMNYEYKNNHYILPLQIIIF
jgi:hypothetical protein